MAVAEIMVRDVVSCRMDDDMDYLLTMMTETRCRHIPVVRDGLVAGMISMGDLVKTRLG
jgi:predicted transcriptional regulator